MPDPVDIAALADRLEKLLLGGERRYSPAEIAEKAGVDRAEARELWRSLGFAAVGEDDIFFTDYDVAALDMVKRMALVGFEDDQLRAGMTRFVGQTFARLASWEGQLMLEMMATRPDLAESEDNVVAFAEQLLPDLEQLQRYVWRRQLAAYLSRVASHAQGADSAVESEMAVGFADLAGFTALTRRVGEAELREVLDSFESLSTLAVGEHGGRIIKTIGDEILFSADDPASAAAIALDLLDAVEADDHVPEIRVGVAYGPVIDRLGDVFGTTVNIAARLTSLARPGWVLVDRGMAQALHDDERWHLKARRPQEVRGYGHLRQWRLRRAGDV